MGYFPNGTAGQMYEDQWCSKCIHRDGPCVVMIAHDLHNYDQCNDKDSILHLLIPRDEKGFNEQCKMFHEHQKTHIEDDGSLLPFAMGNFCSDPDGDRPFLSLPFSLGEHDYATDGRIIVRVAASGKASSLSVIKPEYILKHFEAEPEVLDPLPDFKPWTALDFKPCDTCKGSGGGEFGDCQDCDGWGHGVGKKTIEAVEFQGAMVSDYYLSKIASLPNIRIGRVPAAGYRPDQETKVERAPAFRFKFDGGEGVIMGMLKKD